MRLIILCTAFLLSSFVVQAQLADDMDDESKLYAETKLVNQFFRRFNGEEDEKGERYYAKDKLYRNQKMRKKYIGMLFDGSNASIRNDLKVEFAKDVLDKAEPGVLDFHLPGWFSELKATFTLNGKEQQVTLFMEIEKDHLGHKWAIRKVHMPLLDQYFGRDTTKVGRFLHPLSHELDFMNIRKAFDNPDSVSQFTAKAYTPDHLSVFLYEIKKGNLKFKSVNEMKFHFFQIDGWYFEISEFNRPGYNTGWLISDLVKINSESDKDALRKFLYHESQ
jgi:hypothetical protein